MVAPLSQQLAEELVYAVGRPRQDPEPVGTKIEKQRIGVPDLAPPCTRTPACAAPGRGLYADF
jgi:hypothetical protein